MKTIFVSEIEKLDTFDVVMVIDDDTQNFIGYFLNPKYHNIVQGISEKKDTKALLEDFRW